MTPAAGEISAPAAAAAAAPAAPADLDLVDGLVQLSFAVQSVLGRVANGLDLSVTQLRMLAVLEDREIGMLQLASILELEKSSTTGLVDRAVRRGLVRRVAVPGNRRAVNVTVTPAGRKLVRTARRGVRAEITAMSESLGEDQRDRLCSSITTLVRRHAASHAIPL
jgi:MarR family transcriptional regulator, lower aerobic nicotinate degradation pathway regulator